MKRSTRIPTVVALFILVIGVGSTVFLVENASPFFSQAAPVTNPKEVTITNVTDNAFTVNWITETPQTSLVRVIKKDLLQRQKPAYDERDKMSQKRRTIHSITVADLEPTTKYSFEIISGNKTYTEADYTVTTGLTLSAPLHLQDPAFGTLLTPTHVPVDEAIVYASFEGSQTLSTIVTNGAWMIPLGSLRSSDGTRYFIPGNDTQERLFFVTDKLQSVVATTIQNDSPLPEVQLGKSYNVMPQTIKSPGLIIAQTQTVENTKAQVNTASFQIVTPAKNAGIPSRLPTFKGTASSGKMILLTISGNNKAAISEKVTTDKNNSWSFTPKDPLLPGTYTFTAVTVETGTTKPALLSQQFTILKSGSSVLQAATPSASFKPTPLPSPTLKPSAIASASASTQPVPVTGTAWPTIFLIMGACVLMLIGFAL